MWSALAAIWLVFLADVLSAVFAERAFVLSHIGDCDWVSYRANPCFFSFVLIASLVGTWVFGRILPMLIPKRG
jgi:hypothetical protein